MMLKGKLRQFTVAASSVAFVLGFMALPSTAAAARGERDLSMGVVKSVSCRGRHLTMDLQTSSEVLHLFSNDYFKVDFTAENFTPNGKLNPCREINGLHARAVFYDVPGHPDRGELISVTLKK